MTWGLVEAVLRTWRLRYNRVGVAAEFVSRSAGDDKQDLQPQANVDKDKDKDGVGKELCTVKLTFDKRFKQNKHGEIA